MYQPNLTIDQYAEQNGFTRADGPQIVQFLWDPTCSDTENCIPGCDHSTLWLKDGKPHTFVTQPYGINQETIQEWIRLCDEKGLTLKIDARGSWHNEGRTLLAEISVGEAKQAMNAAPEFDFS